MGRKPDPQRVSPRLKELEAERSHLQDKGKGACSDVIELHPGIADRYRTTVRDLRAALAERSPERKLEVVASVRSLVEKIVIFPNNDPQSRPPSSAHGVQRQCTPPRQRLAAVGAGRIKVKALLPCVLLAHAQPIRSPLLANSSGLAKK
jgi:hypothetical protein